ncbi:Ribosome-binding factor A [Enhygromyxa salina]|uniref:Ribosome-binding factor A n=1 Tax=Enhygromyxa salina TaxID=215803 RepID=A0A0C2D987_9BACT|nr:30S ribosome-binding factor RbfA [Enhygromyxa salina]KIG18165.1 Ribosome-binding factor A [Enhygromyxa salina]
MANRRQQRVEQLLRREIAQLLLRGELRDPRLSPASAVSITGVDISGDLSVARIYVDVLAESLRSADVLDALASGAGVIRHKIGERLVMRRVPELRFEADESIARGARVERILSELRDTGALEPEGAASASKPDPAAGEIGRTAASDAPEDG